MLYNLALSNGKALPNLEKLSKLLKIYLMLFHDVNVMPTRCAPEKIFNLTMRIVLTIFSQCPHDAYTMPTRCILSIYRHRGESTILVQILSCCIVFHLVPHSRRCFNTIIKIFPFFFYLFVERCTKLLLIRIL